MLYQFTLADLPPTLNSESLKYSDLGLCVFVFLQPIRCKNVLCSKACDERKKRNGILGKMWYLNVVAFLLYNSSRKQGYAE